MLELYYMPGTCALASHIALAEAGADYTLSRIDFKTDDQRKPAFLALNPKGRVPVLVTERGPLSETPAILAYIAQTFPAARLAPLGDPYALARMQEFNSYLCSTVHVSHAHGRRAYRWADDEPARESMRRKMPENMHAAFALIESRWSGGPWVMGEDYTVADAYLYTLGGWLPGDGIDPGDFAQVAAHRARMDERAAVRRALAEQAAG